MSEANEATRPLAVEVLTAAVFAPFGEVIEAAAAREAYPINEGTAMRHHHVAQVDCETQGGQTLISLVRAQPRALPFDIVMLERHPLGGQAFVPLSPASRYVVVVAESPAHPPRAFLASGGQGINYRRGTWHHPLIALDAATDFLVVDRGGEGHNCDEAVLAQRWRIEAVALPETGTA